MKKGEKIDVEAVFAEKIQPALIELKPANLTGGKNDGRLSPEKFDVKIISKDPDASRLIPALDDKAGIKRAPVDMLVYFVKEGDGFSRSFCRFTQRLMVLHLWFFGPGP